MTDLTIWYLEARSPQQLEASANPGGIEVQEVRIKQYQFNRFLYELIGQPWQWTDKLEWSNQQWREYAERDSLRTWAAWVEGSPAGYFELEKRSDGSVEICYFGLSSRFIGRGFGGYLLSQAIAEAWQWGASRLSVNTCSLDHPSALANYQARGFQLVDTVIEPG